MAGDAEFDEGNIFEALLEGMKHDVRKVWWIVDYNRQSLDAVIPDRIFYRLDTMFRGMDWRVITLKYGTLLEARLLAPRRRRAARAGSTRAPTPATRRWRTRAAPPGASSLLRDLGDTSGIRELLDEHDDDAAASADDESRRPRSRVGARGVPRARRTISRPAFIAYTIKGFGLPFAGHKDNHAGMMTPEQVESFTQKVGIAEGEEWDAFAGLDVPEAELDAFIASVPFARRGAADTLAAACRCPRAFEPPMSETMSTQAGLRAAARRHRPRPIPSSPIASSRRRPT